MKANSDNKDVKNIYVKSIKMLSYSQAQLSKTQKLLKKTVNRLASVLPKHDPQVKRLLEDIAESTVEKIDLDDLENQLDQVFVLANRSDLLNNNDSQSNTDQKAAQKFVEDVADTIEFSVDNDQQALAQTMQEVVIELSKYIDELKNNNSSDKDNTNILSIYKALRELINQPCIPEKLKTQQKELLEKLNKPLESNEYCCEVTDDAVQFISQFTKSLKTENKALHDLIRKTNNQLSDIRSFMNVTFKNIEDSMNRSCGLEESVNNSVNSIEHSVSVSVDINELKNGISDHLNDIKKKVEENKLAEKEKNKESSQDYSRILDELNASQQEADQLKDQLEETNEKLFKDTLTGISNRLAYDERIEIEVNRFKRTKSPLTLAVWDLDHFKNINDTYGHDVGDRVLKVFSNLIQQRVRATDMFARVGGEEFILLLPDTPIDVALSLNEELREMLLHCKFNYQNSNIPVTASVGLSTFDEDDDEKAVFKRADKALYQSKQNGRNRCTVYEGDDFENDVADK